jgi:hypothetical protein
LFSVPLEPPAPLTRPARPRSIGRLPSFTEPATGASLTADRTLLAVCSYSVTRIYRRGGGPAPPWQILGEVRYESAAIEGIAWDGRDLMLVAEGGAFFAYPRKPGGRHRPGNRNRGPASSQRLAAAGRGK